MEHLSNCHGELFLLFELAFTLPFVGVWLRHRFHRREEG